MNKLTLLSSASVLAIGMATQAAAQTAVQSTLAELCGRTTEDSSPITADTKVAETMEVLADSDCTIELSNDAKLEIKDADFEFLAGGLEVFGHGMIDIRNTMLTGQGMRLDITSGDIIIKDSDIDLDETSTSETQLLIKVGSGAIDLRNNDFHVLATGNSKDNMDIYGTIANIAVIDNHFDVGQDLEITSMGGNVEVTGNTGDVGVDLGIEGDDVTVKENEIDVGMSVVFEADGDLQVKDNDYGNSNDPVVDPTPNSCDVKDNVPAVNTAGCP